MLEFDQDFFLGETRDGFYIEPMMKCAWAAQLEVLQVVHQICERHHIRYFVSEGTLLGAVRHKGYIPWDDDLDICMLREDYERFLTLAPAELTGDYCINSPYTRRDYPLSFAGICNSLSVDYSAERLNAFHGFPYIAGIDIIPLDTVPSSSSERDAFFKLYAVIMACCKICDDQPSAVKDMLPDIEELCNVKIDRNGHILNQLCRLGDTVSQSYNGCESPYLSRVPFCAEEKQPLHKEWFSDCVWLPFENIMVPAPIGFSEILTAIYGDYMTPVQSITHDYPFYKKQRTAMAESLTKRIMQGEKLFNEV